MYDWQQDIVPRLDALQPVPGGFTDTRRGMLQMPDGKKLFVKIAEDDDTKKWTRKEVEVYSILARQNFRYAPAMLSHAEDKTAFAIEFLTNHQFDHPWDEAMLKEVMIAREQLAKLKPFFEDSTTYSLHSVVNIRSRWPDLHNEQLLLRVNRILRETGHALEVTHSMVDAYAAELANWKPREDTLVHQDIRADNFGYDPTGQQGKLVDWNWLCIGDNLMDVTPMFVSVYKMSGVDPYKLYPDLYSKESLLYIIGYWLATISQVDLSHAISPLRSHQAKSAMAALSMLRSKSSV